MSDKALIVAPPAQMVSNNSLFLDITAFEGGQRMATLLSQSRLIPEHYRKNLPDCMIALELAMRIGASPMAVMQNTYMIGKKPGYMATFVIATINSCGRFSPLRYEMSGEGDSRACIAWAYDLGTQEKLESPESSIEMAKAEGWYSKSGSKWQTMPEVMLRYRAAAFFGRMYAPELLMGMKTVEELHDVGANSGRLKPRPSGKSVGLLNKVFDTESVPKKDAGKNDKAPDASPAAQGNKTSAPISDNETGTSEQATEEIVQEAQGNDQKDLAETEPVVSGKAGATVIRRRPLVVSKLIADIALIVSLKDMERWMSGAEEVITKRLTHDLDRDEVRLFIGDHHTELTAKMIQDESQRLVPDEERGEVETPPKLCLSKLGVKESGPTDPDIPFPKVQIEARKQKTAFALDSWRLANFSRFERTMTEDELSVFLGWLHILYENWKEAEEQA